MNAARKQGRYLIYATEEGGFMKFGDPAYFDECVRTGRLDVTPPDIDTVTREYVEPTFIAILTVEKNHDFISGRPRKYAAVG